MLVKRSQDATLSHSTLSANSRPNERPRAAPTHLPISIAPRPTGLTYNALRPGEIRLITICPSVLLDAPIRATLDHRPLERGAFEVLPARTGTQEQPATLYVNDKRVTISGNLVEAFRAFRKTTEPRVLWDDSICINQHDGQEKMEQNKRIKEIIRCAAPAVTRPDDQRGAKDEFQHKLLGIAHDPIWASTAPQFVNMGSGYAFDATTFGLPCESTPALSPGPGTPQTISTTSSPIPLAESEMKKMCILEGGGDSSLWTLKLGAAEYHKLPDEDERLAQCDSKSSWKRSFGTAFPECFPEIQQNPHNQVKRSTKSIRLDDTEEGSNMVFACPFQKFNPHKYHKCLKYTLSRIKDVKQHIYRQHRQPEYYCARCYTTFTTTEDRDAHVRGPVCAKQQIPHFEGVSDEQRRELKKSSCRKLPLQEQWFEVWDVVFPGHPRPHSAFPGNYVEEMVPLLRGVWNEKKAEITSSVLNNGSVANVDCRLLADIMGSVFDRFEAEVTRTSGGSSFVVPKSQGISPFYDLSQSVLDFSFDLDAAADTQTVASDLDNDCNLNFWDF